MKRVKIATAAYPLDWFDDFAAYEAKITRWVGAAAEADLLVFPEYAAMELASLGGAEVAGEAQAALREVAGHEARREVLHCALAKQFNLHILMASAPVFEGTRPFNRAVLIGPQGRIGHQDKQIMTRFEREELDVVGGPGLKIFDTALGRLGILICYDSEFPLLGRFLAECGVEIILVPSCTEQLAGYNRVKIGAMARALESQCVVVHSCIVGTANWCPIVDENHGTAAIYGPPDGFWPENGLIANGKIDAVGWVRGEIELERIARSREEGQVRPFKDWPQSAQFYCGRKENDKS